MTGAQTIRNKPVIGLAGGIGAGKSEVARILESLGAAVIDSDRLAHEALDDPGVAETLRTWWGEGVCPTGGGVDRKAVGAIVFHDPNERARLEAMLYPRVGERRKALLAAYASDPNVRAVVLDTPKLFEVGLDAICHCVIFVEADWAHRARRVADARHWTEEELRRREMIQEPLDTKKARADYVIRNQAGRAELRRKVERVFSRIVASTAPA